MKSFAMLYTFPIAPERGESRYFVDGVRVSQSEYRKLVEQSKRQDSFRSYKFARRNHCRSVIYV